MNSNLVGLFLLTFLLLGLFYFIYLSNRYTDEWYGENSFLKKPKSYKLSLFALFDFELIVFIFIFFGLIYGILKIIFDFVKSSQTYNNTDLYVSLIFIIAITLVISVPIFIFYKKWTFFNQNRDNIYQFDPIAKCLRISKINDLIIPFDEISKVDFYHYKGKISASFAIISLKNNDAHVLTSELPCFDFLSDFFVEIPKYYHEIGIVELYRWLKWMNKK